MEWNISETEKRCTLNGVSMEEVSKEDIIEFAKSKGWKNFKVLLNGVEIPPSHGFPITDGMVVVEPINLAA